MINPRSLVKRVGTVLEVDESQLDIFSQPDIQLPPYDKLNKIEEWENLTKAYLDIETTGLNPEVDRITIIGFKYSTGAYFTIQDEDEAKMLRLLRAQIKLNPRIILVGHNIFAFDLPFIIRRSQILGTFVPFYYERKFDFSRSESELEGTIAEAVIKNSNFMGRPLIFNVIRCHFDTPIIDTMQQLCIWDFSNAKLTSYSLKEAPLQLGLRDKPRLDLGNEGIQRAYQTRDWDTLTEYLKFDLDDTELLCEKLVPPVYYQMAVVPNVKLQDLAYKGMGSKWNKIIRQFYSNQPYPEPEPAYQFQGGFTKSTPGIYTKSAKVDVSSLYPSIMLNYSIWTQKDTALYGLSVLKFLTETRLVAKKQAKTDKQSKDLSEALKILINSGYGALGTIGGYNDYKAAALVTAYGRAIVKHMAAMLEICFAQIAEIDTDGLIFNSDNPQNCFEFLQRNMPNGINVELEFQNAITYIPPSGIKNYIIFHEDGSVTKKGYWRKRDRCKLEYEFASKFIQLHVKNQNAAKEYYVSVLAKIVSRTIDPTLLQFRKKRPKGNKAMADLCEIGEYATFHKSEAPRYHKRTNKPIKPEIFNSNTQPYSPKYYCELVSDIYNKIVSVPLI